MEPAGRAIHGTGVFPDQKRFMDSLHERGMRITLNVHPADGIRPHEGNVGGYSKGTGKDISREEPVAFEITDPAFPFRLF